MLQLTSWLPVTRPKQAYYDEDDEDFYIIVFFSHRDFFILLYVFILWIKSIYRFPFKYLCIYLSFVGMHGSSFA